MSHEHDDWFSDDEQEPPKVVAAAAVGQPDVDVTEEEISAEKRLPGGMTAARRNYHQNGCFIISVICQA